MISLLWKLKAGKWWGVVEGFLVSMFRVVITEKVSRVNKKSLPMRREEWVSSKTPWLGWAHVGEEPQEWWIKRILGSPEGKVWMAMEHWWNSSFSFSSTLGFVLSGEGWLQHYVSIYWGGNQIHTGRSVQCEAAAIICGKSSWCDWVGARMQEVFWRRSDQRRSQWLLVVGISAWKRKGIRDCWNDMAQAARLTS